MGEGKLIPLTTPTPLNRQSRNIAHVITSTISPHKRHLVKIAPGVTSSHIAKDIPLNFCLFLSVYARSFYRPRAQAVEPILTRDTPTDAYSRRVVPFGEDNIFTLQTPKNLIIGHIMESLWKLHMRITSRCWNLARCLTLPSTLSTHKSFSVRGTSGASSPHIKFWDTLFISVTNGAAKLKFGTLVGIYAY